MNPYTVASLVINAMIICILIIRVSRKFDRPENKLFLLFPVLLMMSALCIDLTSELNAARIYGDVFTASAVHMTGLFLKLLLAYIVTIYSFALIEITESSHRSAGKKFLLAVPMFLALIIAILNQKYHLIFWFDSSFVNHAGSFDFLYYLIALFYLTYAFLLLYRKRIFISRTTLYTASILIVFSAAGMLVNSKLHIVNFDIFVHSISCLVMLYVILDSTEMVRMLTKKNKEVTEITQQTIEALTSAIEAKDAYTEGHSSRVCDISCKLAEKMGFNEEQMQNLYYAAMLHDVGKIGIPKEILDKPGKLTAEEYNTIKKHTLIGERITAKITLVPEIHEAARWHHERWDGKGYPDGLSGKDIPLVARIISAADAYDAMSRARVYSPAKSLPEIRQEFIDQRGKQFDPYIDDIVVMIMDEEHQELTGKVRHAETESA